jgi:DNA-binding beta-propeller fold protein YncE
MNASHLPRAVPAAIALLLAVALGVSPAAAAAADALPAGAIRRLGWSPLRIGNSAFALRRDGKEIIAVSPEGIARRFDARTGRLLGRRLLLDRAGINPAGNPESQLSVDGQVAAIVDGPSDRRSIRVIDVATGKVLFRRTFGTARLESVRLSPNGKRLAVAEAAADGGDTSTLRVHDTRTGKCIDLGTRESPVSDLRFSADGERLVASSSCQESPGWQLSYFDVSGGKRLWTRPHRGSEFVVSPDGTTIVTPVYDGQRFQVIQTKRASRESVERFVNYAGAHANASLRFAPDNRTLVIRAADSDHLLLFDLPTRTERKRIALPGNTGSGWGRLLACKVAGRTDTLAVWELASGSVLARFPGAGAVGEVAFSPEGRRVALVDGRGVQIHDLISGQSVARFDAPDVSCEAGGGRVVPTGQPLAFAPDGKTLATGHRDGSVTLWRIPPPPATARIAAEEREKLWTDLASPKAVTGRAAVERLVADPAGALALLKARFAPPAVKPGIAALIGQLDAEAFADRQAASRKLAELGWRAEPALRKAARNAASLEVRRRAEALLREIGPIEVRRPLTGPALRGLRAIEVLHRLGNEPPRQLLDGWAEQTSDRELAAEARAVPRR